MFSFLNPYLSAIKIGGIAVLFISLLWCIHTVKGWHSDSLKLYSVTKELTAEQKCEQGSVCAIRAYSDAKKAQEAIDKAQQDAASANIIAKQIRDNAAKEKAENDANKLKEFNSKLAYILAKHTLSCDEWMKQVNPCAMQ